MARVALEARHGGQKIALLESRQDDPLDELGLADWVRGRPSPRLESRGWKVEYQDYDAERRPIRMRLTYAGIELRLAISQWN